MATEIGFIKSLLGSAIATAADGSQRTLQIGDKLFAHEIVSTGAAGAVEIELVDGSIMDLGRNSQAILDDEVFDLQQIAQVQDDVEALQQAILEGDDPTQSGEATAAGAGQAEGNEGHTTVTVDFLAPQVVVASGFDTTGPSLVSPEIIYEDMLDDVFGDDKATASGGVPVANDDGIAGEAGLLDTSKTLFEDRADFYSPAGTGDGFIDSRSEFVPQQTTVGNILANDSFGADGPGGLTSVTYTGTSAGVTGTLVGGVATLQMADPDSPGTGPIWTLTVEPNGEYTFILNKPYVHSGAGEDIAQELFQYTIQDADGDTASATLTFNIVDDVPTVTTNVIDAPSFELLLTNLDLSASAGYNSSFGYYIKGEHGQPTVGEVVWDGVHNDKTATVTVTGHTPSEIGFFIIPNGNVNADLSNGTPVTFIQINGEWQATLDGTTPLTSAAGHVLFDNTALNYDAGAGAYVYQVDNALPGNLNWEDIAGGGDRDNNDVNINADWTQSGPLGVDESDLSRDASFDFSSAFNFIFGADGQATTNAIVYGLNIADGPTGLFDTATNEQVTLRLVNDTVEGYVIENNAEVIVFTLSLDPNTGVVTLDQQRAVVHDDPTNPDDVAGIAPNLISLNATITDGDGDIATNNIDIGSYIRFEDDAPIAFDDQAYISEGATPLEGNVLTNDIQGADTATVSSVGVQQGVYGNVEFFTDGSYIYTLNNDANNVQSLTAGQKVTDSFEYTLTDKDGDSDTATLNIEVTGTNDLPITTAATASGNEDSVGIAVMLSGTDIDGSIASFIIGSLPEHGALYDGDTLLTVGATVTASDNSAELTFVPDPNWSGDTSFDYTAVDNSGGMDTTSAIASIVVNPVADAPSLIMSMGEPTITTTQTGLGTTNFIVNGSFEDVSGMNANGGIVGNQPIPVGGFVSRLSIPGWERIAGPAMEPHDQNHASVGTTDGIHYMDLGASPGNTSIEQSFTTLSAGQDYQLSFDFRDKAAMQESGQAGRDSGVMNVLWNGAIIATILGDNVNAWDSFSINVTATGNDSLVFAEVGDDGDNWGMALDNVQLFESNPLTTTYTYTYDLSVAAALTDNDGSETLSGITITELPTGVAITTPANPDGTYESGTLTVVSDHELTAAEINAIQGSVTSTDQMNGVTDQATTESNVKVEVDHIDFNALSFVSWGGSVQDVASNIATTVAENVLTLAGNSWKAVSLSQLGVTDSFDWANGTLTVEAKVSAPGELQGILFDNNLTLQEATDQPNLIKLAGSQTWGTNANFTSEDLGDGWIRVEVNLGSLDQSSGVFNNLVFVNDDDNASDGIGSISFRNLTISDNAIDGDKTTDVLLEGTTGDDVLYGNDGDDILIGGAGDDILTGGEGADIFVWHQDDVSIGTVDTVTDFDENEGDVLDLSDLLSDGTSNTIAGVEENGHLQLQISNSGGDLVQTINMDSVSAINNTDAEAILQSLLASNNINDGI